MSERSMGEVPSIPQIEDTRKEAGAELEGKSLEKYTGSGYEVIDERDLDSYLAKYVTPDYTEMEVPDLDRHMGSDIALIGLDDGVLVARTGKLISLGSFATIENATNGVHSVSQVRPNNIRRLFVKIKNVTPKGNKSNSKLIR